MSTQPVYSRESSISVREVASSSFDEGIVTFADHCIPKEVEIVKNLWLQQIIDNSKTHGQT